VHKETVVACVMGSGDQKEIRTFSGDDRRLAAMEGWWTDFGHHPCCQWKAPDHTGNRYHILEDSFEVILANARHIKECYQAEDRRKR